MTGSETGKSDLCDEETCDTGFEKDVDVEIIDGFYYQNVPIMNDKVRLFADYWMKLYSNCCLQRDHAVQLLNDDKVEEAKATLEDWPIHLGHLIYHSYCWRLLMNQNERSDRHLQLRVMLFHLSTK